MNNASGAGVFEDLSEEELYLYCILKDVSGVDQAEFLFYDADSDGEVWRAWPYQWKWFHCMDPLQIEQAARSVGKSLSIKLRAFAFPFVHPGQEMVITAPELVHLEPITRLVEGQIINIRLSRELLPRTRSAITHRPFQIDFVNGSRIIGRIPQRDGKGVKGIHPLWLELDEASDFPDAGWTELIETLKRGSEGAVWRAHGVTRGIRDYFYKFTQPDSGWTVHRIIAMRRPNWTNQERQEKIEMYGSKDAPDYRRNVLGMHGDATNPLFVLHRLMACVDSDEESDYNANYKYIRITAEYLEEQGGDISQLLDLDPPDKGVTYWIGMDVGYTQHPSEILVFVELRDKPKADSYLRLIARVHLQRISHGDQVAAITHMIHHYMPRAFSMDKTGLGLPLFQDLQQHMPKLADRIKGYNFSSKILVDFDSTIEVDPHRGDMIKEAGIERNVLEYSSDVLRDLVDHARIRLPFDRDLIREFQGQTWSSDKSKMDLYGRKRFSQGKFHALDAARMAALGWAQHSIEELVKGDAREPVLDVFVF